MSADRLLFCLSARTRGSWRQFRTAVEELHVPEGSGDDGVAEESSGGLPLYQELRLNLQRLGHIEFFSVEEALQWQVTPPVIATLDQSDGCLGVVTGARSLRLVERLSAAAGKRLVNVTHPGCPSVMLLRLDRTEHAIEIAQEAGFLVQRDAPRALLACLPPIDDPAVRRETAMPFGAEWRVDRFDPARLSWKESSREEAAAARCGLFRFVLDYRRHMLLCLRGKAFEIPAAVGKFFVVRRRRGGLLDYDRTTRRLSVPAVCRPPYLIERALVLCSGRPPSYDVQPRARGYLRYEAIPSDVASLAASLLRQDLR